MATTPPHHHPVTASIARNGRHRHPGRAQLRNRRRAGRRQVGEAGAVLRTPGTEAATRAAARPPTRFSKGRPVGQIKAEIAARLAGAPSCRRVLDSPHHPVTPKPGK